MAEYKELIVGGSAVGALVMVYLIAKLFPWKKNGIGNGNGNHPGLNDIIVKQGMEILHEISMSLNKLSENSAQQTVILQAISKTGDTNGQKLESISGSLALAMERQKITTDMVKDIKNEIG